MANQNTNSTTDNAMSLADVEQLSKDKERLIIIINNRVYDVKKFLDEVKPSLRSFI